MSIEWIVDYITTLGPGHVIVLVLIYVVLNGEITFRFPR